MYLPVPHPGMYLPVPPGYVTVSTTRVCDGQYHPGMYTRYTTRGMYTRYTTRVCTTYTTLGIPRSTPGLAHRAGQRCSDAGRDGKRPWAQEL